MKWCLCQSNCINLILLVIAALTLPGYAEYDGDITSESSGLVKVFHNGKWGSICEGNTSHVEAKVICRSLGRKYLSHGGISSSLPAYMSSVTCRGDEMSLVDCYNATLSSYSYCSSSPKLYVRCKENRKYMFASSVGFPGQRAYLKKVFNNYIGSISFYYHMFGKDMGSLNIYIQTNSSKTEIASISDNQGDGWKYLCLPVAVKYGYQEIVFEAFHGNGTESGIALDDMTISTENCSQWNVSCNFNENTCNYDIENNDINGGWRIEKISGLEDRSNYGDYLVFHSNYNAVNRNSLISPFIDIPLSNAKVTFYYYMPGIANGELQVRFVEEGLEKWSTKTPYFWQDFGDHGTKWQYGCMNLPSKRGRIVFIGFSGRSKTSKMALDDIIIAEGLCQTGITNHVCTFDNPLLCKYIITCMNPIEYTWRRIIGGTPTNGTGPDTDNSNSKDGFYIYAESSYGKPNDTAELKFPVSNVKEKSLKFAYSMHGSGIGQLYVKFKNKSDEKIVWRMKGDQGLYWYEVCLFIEYDINDIVFIAERGDSYLGDIAIDSVSVEMKACPGPFDCDFEDGICNYKVSNTSHLWKIKNQNPDSGDTSSYLFIYSYSNTENIFEMKSPQAFVKGNSSVSFKYKMTEYTKEIAVFTYDAKSRNNIWSSNYNNITEFTTACINFQFSQEIGLGFQMTANTNASMKEYAYLDYISISNTTCESKFFSCAFEDTNMCGFKSFPERASWTLSNGLSGERPKLDHSERTYEGLYVMSSSRGLSRLELPTITMENTFCLNFYYTFFGNGNVSVYNNDTFLMGLSKFDVDNWRNVKITLPKGRHNISYIYWKNNTYGTVAFDSVSTTPGKCSHTDCGENWKPCNNNYTCYPYTAKCDGINNCPDGEDEFNCTSGKRKFRLVGGQSLLSGTVEMHNGSQYSPICAYRFLLEGVEQICSEFEVNGTVTLQKKFIYLTEEYFNCVYREFNCYKRECSSRCYCSSLYVTCSNTTCEEGEVKCPPGRNETNSADVCIRQESLCDGEIDCEDGTDEGICDQCTDEQWQCRDKKCIKKDLHCNGIKDCKDGSDEFHCFRYIGKTIKFFYNDSYKYICENNLKNERIAKQLCSYVGRSNGTFGDPILGDGVLFTSKISYNTNQLIPGFEAVSIGNCSIMVLNCIEQQCGNQNMNLIEPNIRYGQKSLDGKWPWDVQIFAGSQLICTGVIINSHYVLTAAHCLIYVDKYDYSIRVGSVKKNQGTKYNVFQSLKHEQYDSNNFNNDIGLIYIKSKIKMSANVQPICLPENPAPKDKECYVTGWGMNEKGTYPTTLHETKVYLLEDSFCKKYYSRIGNATFCANHREDNQPTCYVDSGGPLACRDTYGNWVIYGITSFGKSECTGPDSSPAAFTDVSKLVMWIEKNT
ncbi:MAM and LDL-receptor class A domain-containing protein 2-like isoform X2 [Octopus sinensis]|uniref:MAM and LDL-receptor class A domain-containing protein 2-like isoform X2 n=1 Tax=Octopus sinensis TaxID=2607531 RepID=A0A7E6EQQ6_9MOLL|nr:MAM and LDL-receptor class A domain-containing protein 2-like isoform X2 [Octopus sinensis]